MINVHLIIYARIFLRITNRCYLFLNPRPHATHGRPREVENLNTTAAQLKIKPLQARP